MLAIQLAGRWVHCASSKTYALYSSRHFRFNSVHRDKFNTGVIGIVMLKKLPELEDRNDWGVAALRANIFE